jgi:FAD/FMN-containing dehydrogenase
MSSVVGRSGLTGRPTRRRIPADKMRRLASVLRGSLVGPQAAEYSDLRRVWNGMIDRYPALIVRCVNDDDVAAALAFGVDLGLPIAVRGGGHSVAGHGTCDSGLVIDLSPMDRVAVDVARQSAEVGGGVRWGSLDAATATHGLATTGGLISTTGIAGLTLGGGIGWLMRQHGLACDNLVEADLVTAAGGRVRASDEATADLMWGLRGGGGNFGIVTRFVFRLHPVTTVLGGMVIHRMDDAARLISEWATLVDDAPDALTSMAALISAPPAPFIPRRLRGQPVLAFVLCWSGDLADGERELAPLRRLGRPAVDLVGPMPYPMLQGMLDGGAPGGLRNYWKSGQLRGLSRDSIERIVEHAGRRRSAMSQIHIHQLGGAVGRIAQEATAYPHRDATHTLNIVATWRDPADDVANIRWARGLHAAVEPALRGAYVNFLGDEGQDSVAAAYGEQPYRRLASLKRRYDPDNILRINQNIAPGG